MATREIKTKFSLEGEKEWKKEMSSINSNLKTLKSEMAASAAAYKGQANSIEALTAKNKILKDAYDQQAAKVKSLKSALTEAEKVYADQPEKVDKYRQQLNYATVQLVKMDDELKQNEKYIDEAKKSTDGHAKSIDQFGNEIVSAKAKTLDFGDVLRANLASEAIITGIKSLLGAIKSVGGELKDLAIESAEFADELATQATITGLSADKLQEYQYMAELTDTSVETITGSLSKLIRNMNSAKGGTGSAAEAFDALGVSIVDVNGELRSNDDVFRDVIDSLGKMDNETQRDAYSMSIFGKSAQDLNPLIATGADGIAAFAQEAHDMGYIMDDEAIGALLGTSDAMERMKNSLTAAKNKLGADFAPGMEAIFEDITEIVQGTSNALSKLINKKITLKQFINEVLSINKITEKVRDLIPLLASATSAWIAYKGAMAISGVIETVSKGMKALKLATEAETAAQAALNVVMNANAFAIVATVVAGCVAGLMALNAVSKESVVSVDALTESERKLVDAATESAAAFREQTAATQEVIDGTNSQMDHVKALADELAGLADASGNVSEADQARAKFILGELNNALGTEYEMVNGQIQAYGELEDSIYSLIEAKRAEALLEAYKSDYQEALKGKKEAYEALTLAAEDWMAQSELVKQTEADLTEAMRIASNESGQYTAVMAVGAQARVLKIEEELRAQKDALAEKQEIYQTNSEAYDAMCKTIGGYEAASMELMQGHYDSACDILNGESEQYSRYADDVSDAVKDVLTSLELNMIEAGEKAEQTKANFDAGIKGFGQKQVDEANKSYKQAMDAYKKAYSDAYGVGADIGDGMTNGMESRRSGILEKVRNLVSSIFSTARREADSHSPSRKMVRVFGDIWDGAIVGTEQKEAEVQAAAQQQIKSVFKAMSNGPSIPTNLDLSASISAGTRLAAVSNAGSVQMDSSLIVELKAIRALIAELKSMGIYLDSGKLVGGIAPEMNRSLGKFQAAEARGI